MTKRQRFAAVLAMSMLITTSFAGCGDFVSKGDTGRKQTIEISVGEDFISDGAIVYDGFLREEANILADLVEGACGKRPSVSGGSVKEKDHIKLAVDKSLGAGWGQISIEDGLVTISAGDKDTLLEKEYEFANLYLGYAFAGTSRERLLAHVDHVAIPENKPVSDTVWMEEREPIICLWNTTTAHGNYYNPNTCKLSELMSYSDDQLYEYVKMMNFCGFSGIQVTDMCSAWAGYGNYEFVHQRIRFMADCAHSLGMNFTLWVWGAEFNGYGWWDDSVTYYDYNVSEYAKDIPSTVETFEKYYTIYAELADVCDRVIVHYNDPGHLKNDDDIAFFAGMLMDKFKAVNPDVIFGVNCYTDAISKPNLNDKLGSDIFVYECAATSPEKDLTNFRVQTRECGLGLGVWSWNLIEMEIDQLAEMNVNAEIIKDTYLRSQTYDEYLKPTYWSEMDSYHVLNLASLYVAGQLLMNPEQDTNQLLYDISESIVGQAEAADLRDVFLLIQDARSGDSWSAFRWEYPDFVMTSPEYPAEDILNRADKALEDLDRMIGQNMENNTVPLPMDVTTYLRLIRPHVAQIRSFASFRRDFAEAEKMLEEGKDKADISHYLAKIYEPVREYNTIVGIWGQVEQRTQYMMLEAFCEKAGIDVPEDPVFTYYRKQRIYQEFCTLQKNAGERINFTWQNFEVGVGFGERATKMLMKELEKDGLLTYAGNDAYYLTEWENFMYEVSFN